MQDMRLEGRGGVLVLVLVGFFFYRGDPTSPPPPEWERVQPFLLSSALHWKIYVYSHKTIFDSHKKSPKGVILGHFSILSPSFPPFCREVYSFILQDSQLTPPLNTGVDQGASSLIGREQEQMVFYVWKNMDQFVHHLRYQIWKLKFTT